MNQAQPPWVIVTGGTRGIGRALVQRLAVHYRVAFTWRHSVDEAHRLIEQCTARGHDVESFECDGSHAESVLAVADQLVARWGAPAALINNAGVTRDGALLGMEPSAWLDLIDQNLNASFYWTRALLPAMVEAGRGTVLMMSSVSGIKGNAGQTNYSATKAALIGLTRSLALEVARFGVRINAIAPGVIDTDMTRSMSDKAYAALCKSIPLRHAGDVDDIASMAEYLIGEQGRYITGQCFVVDGGMTA
ncbi:SDR family oxidoreductase [Burkholderia stabilis]|uniref:SDR family oxidoreductase n=1 Tax=Burkholderia stabilis TaxID=95485 RepID=UPI00158C73FE|nr:SDR family NAD(P)-dependent oxidoreductase [Burkholderia stabilis]